MYSYDKEMRDYMWKSKQSSLCVDEVIELVERENSKQVSKQQLISWPNQ